MVHRKKVATYVVNANVEVTTEDREGEKLLQKSLILLAEFRNIDDETTEYHTSTEAAVSTDSVIGIGTNA